jgi:hypothetical protein
MDLGIGMFEGTKKLQQRDQRPVGVVYYKAGTGVVSQEAFERSSDENGASRTIFDLG